MTKHAKWKPCTDRAQISTKDCQICQGEKVFACYCTKFNIGDRVWILPGYMVSGQKGTIEHEHIMVSRFAPLMFYVRLDKPDHQAGQVVAGYWFNPDEIEHEGVENDWGGHVCMVTFGKA